MLDTISTPSSRDPSVTVTASVGTEICFKADIEQSAIVKEVRYGGWNGRRSQVLVDVDDGEYAGPNQWLDLEECWNMRS